MNACPDRLALIQALLDDELDAANSHEIESHLRSCGGCSDEVRRLESLRQELARMPRHRAPPALRARIERAIGAATAPAPAPRRASVRTHAPWLAGGAMAGLAASLALMMATPQLSTVSTQDQIVSSHVRSLLATHLTDVATSDRHVVKPWFNGRVDYAPPVIELADAGFPLVGGRLDYIDAHVVPAIVYRRRLHTINLFVLRDGKLSTPGPFRMSRDGYRLVAWRTGGLEYWAVSDIEPGDLDLFQRVFRARSAAPSGGVSNVSR